MSTPPGFVQRLEDRDLMAPAHQLAGGGQARGPGADDRDFRPLPVRRPRFVRLPRGAVHGARIGDEALEAADRHGFVP